MDSDKLDKAVTQLSGRTPVTKEPSRWQAGGGGHFPSYSTQKMRRMAASGLGEMGAMQREVSRMSRTKPENRTGPLERHIITLDDVTRGLGIDNADEQRLQRLVSDTLPTFTQKTQTQRIMHARGRFNTVLRDSMKHVDSDSRMEVSRRAVAYWKRHHQTDYLKSPTIRFRGGEARKSMGPRLVISIETLSKGGRNKEPMRARMSGGPFIGPKGGKWADAKHTKPWNPSRPTSVEGDDPAARHRGREHYGDPSLSVDSKGSFHGSAAEHQKAHAQAFRSGKGESPGKGALALGSQDLHHAAKWAARQGHEDHLRAIYVEANKRVGFHLTVGGPLNQKKKHAREALRISTDYGAGGKHASKEHRASARKSIRLVIPIDALLEKAGARGGKYYKRVATGNVKRPYRYYYTRAAYERDHGKDDGHGGHLPGFEMMKMRALAKLRKQVLKQGTKTKDALDNVVLAAEAVRLWVKAPDFGLPAQTIHKYAKDTGRKNQFGETIREYTKARMVEHNDIIDAATSKVSRVPVAQKPVAIVMMGGGGAGKGTLLKAVVHNHGDFVHVDPDDVKGHLPEYQKAMNLGAVDGTPVTAKDAAWMAHEESSDIAEKILAKGIANRQNVIVDGTGKNAQKHADKIKALKKAGYHVKLLYAHTEMDEAVKRAAERADRSGRYVPIPVLEDAHTKIPGNFEFVARHADEFALFRSERPPKKLWTHPPETIHDQSEVSEFKALGKRLHAKRGITLPPIPSHLMPAASPERKVAAKSLDAFLVIQSLRKAAGKPPSLSMGDVLKRITDNHRHYPLDSTHENATEGGEAILRAEAEKLRGTESLHKALPSHFVRVAPLRLEW